MRENLKLAGMIVLLAILMAYLYWYYSLAPCDWLRESFPFAPVLNRCITP